MVSGVSHAQRPPRQRLRSNTGVVIWGSSSVSHRRALRRLGNPGHHHLLSILKTFRAHPPPPASVLVEGIRNVLEELTLSLPRSTSTSAAEVDLPALVDTYAPTLFRVAHAVLRNRTEAEDVVQDTFLRVLQNRHKLPAIRDLRPWLIRIAWNLALDRHRRVRPDQADDLFLQTLVARQTPTDRVFEEAQQTRRVLGAIDRLPRAEREALLLSAIEELSTPEIARIMKKSESAIRALIHRARTRLRERLEKGAKA